MNEPSLEEAFRSLQVRLDRAPRSKVPPDLQSFALLLTELATRLDAWCRETVRAPEDELSDRGDTPHHPLTLLKDCRQRSAFQLRILVEEARTLRGTRHQEDYLERVRAFALGFR